MAHNKIFLSESRPHLFALSDLCRHLLLLCYFAVGQREGSSALNFSDGAKSSLRYG